MSYIAYHGFKRYWNTCNDMSEYHQKEMNTNALQYVRIWSSSNWPNKFSLFETTNHPH